MPAGATWQMGTTLIEVSFSEPVVDSGSLDAGNWSYSPPDLASITSVASVGGIVRITLDAAPLSITGVSFDPPPFDVVGQVSGLNAEAFADFPVATV